MRHVEARNGTIQADIVNVLNRCSLPRIVARATGVNRLRPDIIAGRRKTLTEALLHADLQAVVAKRPHMRPVIGHRSILRKRRQQLQARNRGSPQPGIGIGDNSRKRIGNLSAEESSRAGGAIFRIVVAGKIDVLNRQLIQ